MLQRAHSSVLSDRRVAMLVFNALDPDPRVWREAESLSHHGYRVVVLAQREENQKKIQRTHGFILCRFFRCSPYEPRLWRTAVAWLGFLGYVYSRKRRHFAIVHCHDADTLPFGRFLSKRDRAKLVYDAHEVFFDYVPTVRYTRSRWRRLRSRLLRRIVSMFEKRFIGRCDLVLTVNSSLSHLIQDQYGLVDAPAFLYNARKRVTVEKTSYLRQKMDIPRHGKILFYQGAIRPDREIERMVEVLPLLGRDWFLVVAGKVTPPDYLSRLMELAESLHVRGRFLHAGFLEYEKELLVATASSDVGIFLLPPTNLTYQYSLANKVFDYLMAEVPIVVNELPETKQLIDQYGVGLIVHLERRSEIAESIKKLVEDREKYSVVVENIRQAKQELCWERQEGKLISAYQRLLS